VRRANAVEGPSLLQRVEQSAQCRRCPKNCEPLNTSRPTAWSAIVTTTPFQASKPTSALPAASERMTDKDRTYDSLPLSGDVFPRVFQRCQRQLQRRGIVVRQPHLLLYDGHFVGHNHDWRRQYRSYFSGSIAAQEIFRQRTG